MWQRKLLTLCQPESEGREAGRSWVPTTSLREHNQWASFHPRGLSLSQKDNFMYMCVCACENRPEKALELELQEV